MNTANNKANTRQQIDAALAIRIKAGDPEALEKIVDRYLPQLTGFFRYMKVPDQMVDDLVQETFEKLIKKISLYDETKKFSSWLMTMGRNIYLDEYRRNSMKNRVVQNIQQPVQPSVEEQVIVRQSASEILKALKPHEKFLIELRVFQGMQFAEIAELTGENPTTLRSRFFRLIERLKISQDKI